MRVISGSAKGTRLDCPPGDAVRPTPELAKGAVFNVLADLMEGATVLDIFAGAGTFGIEALSRGAAFCLFVELSPQHISCLRRNLERTHLADKAEVIRHDALRCVGRLKKSGKQFGIIFLGPPFPMIKDPRQRAAILDIIAGIGNEGIAPDNAVLVLQHDEQDPIPPQIGPFVRSESRKYGRNVFAFFHPSPKIKKS